jgi:hypothetical protein
MIDCRNKYTNHNNTSRGCGVVTTVHHSATNKGEVAYMADNNSGVNLRENGVFTIQTLMQLSM